MDSNQPPDITESLKSIDARLALFVTGLAGLDAKVTSLDAKVTSLDAKVASLDARFASLDAKFASLDEKLSSLDAKVSSQMRSSPRWTRESHEEVRLA